MTQARVAMCAAVAMTATVCLQADTAIAQPAGTRAFGKDGLKMELAALGADQVRAFFLARGFKRSEVERIVLRGCIFRSAIGSAFQRQDDPAVTISLAAWRVVPVLGESRSPIMREDWEKSWKALGAGEDAATAFYWALFPTEQIFAPTDYNWGMLTFGLPPGTRFSLDVRWRTGNKDHSHRLETLECGK